MAEFDEIEFKQELETGIGQDDDAYEAVEVDGVDYRVGELVKTTVSRTGEIPCEEHAVLVAPITRVLRRTEFNSDALLSVAVSFAHLVSSVSDVEKVMSDEVQALWEAEHTTGNDTVIFRYHTGNDEQCPACRSDGAFLHLAGDAPAYLKQKQDEDWF